MKLDDDLVAAIVHALATHQMSSCAMTGESASPRCKCVTAEPTVRTGQMRGSVALQILFLPVSGTKPQTIHGKGSWSLIFFFFVPSLHCAWHQITSYMPHRV